MASYLKQTMAVNVSDSVKAALQEAYSAGYQQHDTDLDQRVTGLQNRMNSLAANSSQATRQASADHSKLEQLNQVWQEMFYAFSDNTKLLDDVLHQMQMPIEISAKEAVRAIQTTSGKSVRKMISAEVVQWLRGTRQAVADDADTIKDAKEELSSELRFAGKWLEVVLGGVVLAMIVPSVTLKVLFGALGIIGGWAYAKFKS